MAYGQYRLQFLHISDLHAKGPHEKEAWRRRRVLGEAWRRNLEVLQQEEGRIHFVFFTGDAAQSGRPEEFEEFASFIADLRRELDVEPGLFFIVPGNHDIDRTRRAGTWESMRMRLAATYDLLGVSRWMNGIAPRPPLGFVHDWLAEILDRESPYRE